jgi:hypothetical protein
MEWLSDPQIWISLLTLTVLEIVLGIDNIVFISILAGKLPADQQKRARIVGLSLALITRCCPSSGSLASRSQCFTWRTSEYPAGTWCSSSAACS